MRSLFFFLFIGLFACSKEVRYSKEAMLSKAQAADPSVSLIMPKADQVIHCADYTPVCLSAHIVKVKDLEFIAVEYTTEPEAKAAAAKYRGFYYANWFFDDVAGEPVLEKFVQEGLEAKKP